MIEGIQLKRHVESTAWSSKQGLAGRALDKITLADLTYRGWHEQSLRYLSHGRFTSVVFTKNVSESVFVSKLLTGLRESNIDLDRLAEHVHRHQGHHVPSKHEDALQFMEPLVDHVVMSLNQLNQTVLPSECHQGSRT